MLESVVGNSRIIYDAAIIDPNGVAILDTNPALNGKPVPERTRLAVCWSGPASAASCACSTPGQRL
jgi:hypothetical protein